MGWGVGMGGGREGKERVFRLFYFQDKWRGVPSFGV